MNKDLQSLRERGYDGIADEIENGLKRWDDGLKRRGAISAEGYLNREFGLHIHVRLRGLTNCGVPQCYCAYLRFAPDNAYVPPNFSRRGVRGKGVETHAVHTIVSHCNGTDGELTVLVNPVQIMELPEWVRLIPDSTVVRLQRLDDCLSNGVHASNLSIGARIPLTHLSNDGELGVPDLRVGHSLGRGELGTCGLGEGKGQMVEGSPYIKNAIPDKQGEAVRSGSGPHHPEAAICQRDAGWWVREWGFWVRLVNGEVGIGFDPQAGLSLEHIQVFAGPIQFEGEALGRWALHEYP